MLDLNEEHHHRSEKTQTIRRTKGVIALTGVLRNRSASSRSWGFASDDEFGISSQSRRILLCLFVAWLPAGKQGSVNHHGQ